MQISTIKRKLEIKNEWEKQTQRAKEKKGKIEIKEGKLIGSKRTTRKFDINLR